MSVRLALQTLLVAAVYPVVTPFSLHGAQLFGTVGQHKAPCRHAVGSISALDTARKATKSQVSMQAELQHLSCLSRRSVIAAGLLLGTGAFWGEGATAQDLSGLRKMITGVGGDAGEQAKSADAQAQSGAPFCEIYQCADASTETLGGLLKPFQAGSFSMQAPDKGWAADTAAGDERYAWADGKGGRVAVSAAPAGPLVFRVPSPTAGAVFGKAVVANDLARVGSALARARGAEYTGGRARLVAPGGAIVYNLGLKTPADRLLLAVAAPAPPLARAAAAADADTAPPPAEAEVWTVSCAAPLGEFASYKVVFGEILQSVALQ
jgi:hypothetical protein